MSDFDDEEVVIKAPRMPRREATPGQALLAIGLVFLIGIIIGFVLAHTL